MGRLILFVIFILELSTWQLYLAACTVPPFVSFVLVSFLPESPKFLMSRGRNKQAMKVFQTLFSINTGRQPEEYPVSTSYNIKVIGMFVFLN